MVYALILVIKRLVNVLPPLGVVGFIAASSLLLHVSAYAIEPSYSTASAEWDVNQDGVVDISDLLLVIQYLGKEVPTPPEHNPDVNGDGKADILDLILVARNIGVRHFSVYIADPLNGTGIPGVIVKIAREDTEVLVYRGVTDDSGMVSVSVPGSITDSLVISIRDEDTPDVGNYHDIDRMSIIVEPGGTITVQMEPQFEIKDYRVANTHATGRDFMLRLLNKNSDAIVDSSALIGPQTPRNNKLENIVNDPGNYQITMGEHFLDFSVKVVEIGEEMNSLLGYDLISFGNGNVVWDYSSNKPSTIEVEFDGEIPVSAIIHCRGFAMHEGDLEKQIRLCYVKLFALNNLPDDRILTSEGEFTSEFIEAIRIRYALPPSHDFSYGANELPASPVANAGEDIEVTPGELVSLNSLGSLSSDSPIVSWHWEQQFMNRWSWSYASSNVLEIGAPSSPMTSFIPEHWGKYPVKLTVANELGYESTDIVNVIVRPAEPLFDIRGVDTGVFSHFGLYGTHKNPDGTYRRGAIDWKPAIELFDRIEAINANYIQITPNLFMKEDSYEIFDSIHDTMPDEVLKGLIDMAQTRGMGVLIEPNVYIVPEEYDETDTRLSNRARSHQIAVNMSYFNANKRIPILFSGQNVELEKLLASYSDLLMNRYVRIAKENNCEIFSIANDSSSLTTQAVNVNLWNEMIIKPIREYAPELLLTMSFTCTREENRLTRFDIINYLDIIGLNTYPPGSNLMDPTLEEMHRNITELFEKVLIPGITDFNKPVLLLEYGMGNYDGQNITSTIGVLRLDWTKLDNQEQQMYTEALIMSLMGIPDIQLSGVFYFVDGFVPQHTYTEAFLFGNRTFRDKPLEEYLRIIFR